MLTCPTCGMTYKQRHTCPVMKCKGACLDTIVDRVKRDVPGKICTRCGEHHLAVSNASSFREWKDEGFLCVDCYKGDPAINEAKEKAWKRLIDDDIAKNRTDCSICRKPLLSPKGDSIHQLHRDHLDIFTKRDSVSMLVFKGRPIEQVLEEADVCRNLCVRCHSIVTYSERCIGITRMRTCSKLDQETKDMAHKKVEDLTRLLVSNYIPIETPIY